MHTFLNKLAETKHKLKPFKNSQMYTFLEYFFRGPLPCIFPNVITFYCVPAEQIL